MIDSIYVTILDLLEIEGDCNPETDTALSDYKASNPVEFRAAEVADYARRVRSPFLPTQPPN